MLYNIGGLWLHFTGSNPYFEKRSVVFQRDASEKSPEECDMRISIELVDDIIKPEGDEVYGGQAAVILRKKAPEKGYYIYGNDFTLQSGHRRMPSLLDANSEWSDVTMQYLLADTYSTNDDGSIIPWSQYGSFLSIGLAFRNLLMKKNGLHIHSASIEYQGKGLIFSAPSGTGKSTHVRLWHELYKDEVTIINEDRPAIRYMNNVPMLCGTPWSGTSDHFVNKNVPLNGIVMLTQSPVNTIEKLSGSNILQMLMPRCFLPYFDPELMVEAIATLEKLVNEVPVYLLKCRPDYEAVELVRKCLI